MTAASYPSARTLEAQDLRKNLRQQIVEDFYRQADESNGIEPILFTIWQVSTCFGVTESRARQLLNELLDVQRISRTKIKVPTKSGHAWTNHYKILDISL